jgi:hypothetical protein
MRFFIALFLAATLLSGAAEAANRDDNLRHAIKSSLRVGTPTKATRTSKATPSQGYVRAKASCELQYAALENQGFSTLQSRMWIAQMINNSARHNAYITNCLIVMGYGG